jgi:hypothetical protein
MIALTNEGSGNVCLDGYRYPLLFFLTWYLRGKYGNSFADGSISFLRLWRIQMETILIVLLIVFLFGGGGWGYSRWRRD